jgi:hypothetical protein
MGNIDHETGGRSISSHDLGVSVVCMLLLFSMALCYGGCSPDSSRGGISRITGQFGGGNSLDAGGATPLVNDDPGNAYPLTQQSLFDFSQTGIAPWGPVAQSMQVVVGGQTYSVNRLMNNDPFTAMYQMENGDIVFSNEPLSRLVGTIVEGPPPPAEAWTGPDGPQTFFSGEIMVLFKDEVTQQQIAAEIAQHNLHVLMSWFEPPEQPGTGNAIAYFEFRYDPLEFTTFAAAYAHFNADPLVVAAVPDAVDAFTADYAQGLPNDYYYTQQPGKCRQVNVLHADTSSYPRFGPPVDPFASTAVAVFDDGVARLSEDFQILGAAPFYRKISWCGVTTYEDPKATKVGSICGEATLLDPNRQNAVVTHGTAVAGTITAATNNNLGIAGLAPQCGVVPIRLSTTWDQQNVHEQYSPSSIVNALVALRKTFRPHDWVENVSVANHSYAATDDASHSLYNKWFSRDAGRCDRLHVAAAGNTCDAQASYPAALIPVLGVSGLVARWDGAVWWPYIPFAQGSTWYTDQTAPPEQRLYPVSGIYGFCNDDRSDWADVSMATASPIPGSDESTNYINYFRGTSFAAPQVAALAALLRNARPSASYSAVANRIVSTRRLDTEQTMLNTYNVPLAGLIDFNAALANW